MKELHGNLWRYYQAPFHVICITTNGMVKKDGCGVMGRGCALQAKQRVPGLDRLLGAHIQTNGNMAGYLTKDIIAFPVKHNWYESADLELIRGSAHWLGHIAAKHPEWSFILPRPGCGNGKLSYGDVKPILVELLPDNVYVIDFA